MTSDAPEQEENSRLRGKMIHNIIAMNETFNQPQDSESKFVWTFKEFEERSRSVWWYVVAGVIVALAILYSFATNNFLFTVIIVLAMLVIFARQFQSAGHIECEISHSGIRVGKRLYSFNDLASFSIIIRDDNARVLYIHEARGLRNILPLPLIDIESEYVRMFLLQFLEEDTEHQHEPVWDWLTRTLRL